MLGESIGMEEVSATGTVLTLPQYCLALLGPVAQLFSGIEEMKACSCSFYLELALLFLLIVPKTVIYPVESCPI